MGGVGWQDHCANGCMLFCKNVTLIISAVLFIMFLNKKEWEKINIGNLTLGDTECISQIQIISQIGKCLLV